MADVEPNLFFYRSVAGAEQGPATIEQLGRLIADRKVTAITQIRESGCLIWRYANDFSSLADFFAPKQQNTAGDPFSKPLVQLTARDLPQFVAPYWRTATNMVFFFFYVPTTLAIVFQTAAALIGLRGIQDMYSAFGMKLPQIVPFWLILSVGACMVALCVGPLAAWIIYAKRVLNWPKFAMAVAGTYLLPTLALAVLALACQQIEISWLTQ